MTINITISPIIDLMAKAAGKTPESILERIEESIFYSFNEICGHDLTPENPVFILAESPQGILGFCWTEHQIAASEYLRERYGAGMMCRANFRYAKTRHFVFVYYREGATDERA